jgi:hypothetical protein
VVSVSRTIWRMGAEFNSMRPVRTGNGASR